jgi:hypothetical protein
VADTVGKAVVVERDTADTAMMDMVSVAGTVGDTLDGLPFDHCRNLMDLNCYLVLIHRYLPLLLSLQKKMFR